MSNKWRVSFGKNKVLGHFAAKTPEEAVDKAIAKHNFSLSGEGYYTAVRAGNADAVEYTVMR